MVQCVGALCVLEKWDVTAVCVTWAGGLLTADRSAAFARVMEDLFREPVPGACACVSFSTELPRTRLRTDMHAYEAARSVLL